MSTATPPAEKVACPGCSATVQLNKNGTLAKRGHQGATPCTWAGHPYGAARIPKPARGWYRDPVTGAKLRRVTSILDNGVPKAALIFWAGNTVAECAMENLPRLIRDSRNPHDAKNAYDWLRRAHTRKKEERGDVGDAVHKIINAHVLQEPMPEGLLDDPEMRPFLQNFLRFVDEFEVTFEASEMVVGSYKHGYAGTLDYIVRSPHINGGRPTLGDTKTGGELDVRLANGLLWGVYPEAGLQMSGYRNAEVCWQRDGTRLPMPETCDEGIVLHLRPQGYRVYPAKCGPEVFEKFLNAMQIDDWSTVLAPAVVSAALPVPVRKALEVA